MIESMLSWFTARQGKVTYSMERRSGPNSYDCSSAIYYALIQAGVLPVGAWIGNTDSLFRTLEENGFERVPTDAQGNAKCKRGDIFIWGKRGASGGAFGHTGAFVDADRIIHCNYANNGITINNHDAFWIASGMPEYAFYRYTGKTSNPPAQPMPPTNTASTYIAFDRIYNVDAENYINDMWQVRTNALAPKGFTWDDNGIPSAPLVQVDKDGYRTPDQDFKTHKTYKLPGAYGVLDQVWESGVLWYLVRIGGYGVWVDSAAVKKVDAHSAGTATPKPRPAATPPPTPKPTPAPTQPPKPTAPPTTKPPETQPPVTIPPTTPPETVAPVEPETKPPKKEKPMAFSQAQLTKIQRSSDEVLAKSAEVDSFQPVISDKIKTVAYFVTDGVTLVSTFGLCVAAIFGVMDGNVAIYLNAAVAAFMIGLKQTFRLSSKKQ